MCNAIIKSSCRGRPQGRALDQRHSTPAVSLREQYVEAVTLDQIVNEMHSYLEPIRAQCDLFCSKVEEYGAVLERYTREAIDRHMAEFDRRQKERERLGVELLAGESFFHCSDGKKLIQPSPQEEEFQEAPPHDGWIWTQFCDYNYVGLPDMDVFWRPPEPAHPLEWLWQSLPWWGHTSPTLTRTKREWTDEEHLMCECLLLASIHDMRFVTAPSRHERIFYGRPYPGRFRRDEVAKDMWDAMHKSPRGLEDLQISWAWAKAGLDGCRLRQPSRKPPEKTTPRGEAQELASLIPELPSLVKIAEGAWFGLLAVRAGIAAKYGAEKGLSPEQKEAVEEQFSIECFRAMRALECFLVGLPGLDRAARVRWHGEYHSLSQRIQSLLEDSLDKNTANQAGFRRLKIELANILMAMGFESTGEIWAIDWGDSPDSSPTDVRALQAESSKTAGVEQARNGWGQPSETTGKGEQAPNYVFRNEGATWRIVYAGCGTTAKDSLGMKYICYLIDHPNTPIECRDIERACSAESPEGGIRLDSGEAIEADLHTNRYDLKQLEKWEAKDIEGAIDALNADIADTNDPTRKTELRKQVAILENYLRKNMNNRGQPRSVDEPERARSRVQKAINAAKRAIKRSDEEIGSHFDAVKGEGTAYIYKPGREIPWTLE